MDFCTAYRHLSYEAWLRNNFTRKQNPHRFFNYIQCVNSISLIISPKSPAVPPVVSITSFYRHFISLNFQSQYRNTSTGYCCDNISSFTPRKKVILQKSCATTCRCYLAASPALSRHSSRKTELILQSFISHHVCVCSCHIFCPAFSTAFLLSIETTLSLVNLRLS